MINLDSYTFKRGLWSTLLFVGVVLLFKVFTFFSNDHKDEDASFQAKFNTDYRIYALNIPADLTFCGEPVPVHDQDVYERIDRELLVNTYWQSNSMLFHKRASKWFPVIEPILKENGIPDDFKYLAIIESGLTNVVSPAGATGFWQILKKTGQEYGLEVNSEVDERYHVEKATQAACHYIKDAYDIYGSWTLAAASYNMGMNGLQKQLKRQNVSDYYDLLLNQETSRYVFRIIAAKEILENPTKYGFYYREKDLYATDKFTLVKVDTAIKNLPAFAESQKINYKILKIFNPWLRQSYLNNKEKRTYQIKIPKGGYYDFSSLEADTVTIPDTNLQSDPAQEDDSDE